LDYKDHVVLQFTTLNEENQVETKFKFVPFADVILKGEKVNLSKSKPLKDIIKYKDVVSESIKKDVDEKSFFKSLKFYWGSVSLNGRNAENFLKENMPCMDTTVRVLLDKFGSKHNHYVIQMEDSWISKEFMSVAYSAANAAIDESEEALEEKKLHKGRDTKDWDDVK